MMVLWSGGLWGVSSISRSILDTAAGAIVGAAEVYKRKPAQDRPVVGVTAAGSSALKYLDWIKPALEERGYRWRSSTQSAWADELSRI